MDLLVPGVGEIIGGSQREENYDVLHPKMLDIGIVPEEYEWYQDIRKYGTFPHAGFGLGLERAVMYLTGMKNIRDVIPYPRTPNSLSF
jgi:asparaginyl-tRNA synthetase (EC 6.1.1.22)